MPKTTGEREREKMALIHLILPLVRIQERYWLSLTVFFLNLEMGLSCGGESHPYTQALTLCFTQIAILRKMNELFFEYR